MRKSSRTPLAIAVGRAIAQRRVAAKLTQGEVAERLGIGQEAVSRLERGVATLTVARLAELATICKCPIEQLLTEASDREDDQTRAISSIVMQLPAADRHLLIQWIKAFAERLSQ